MSLRDKYTNEEWDELEEKVSNRNLEHGFTLSNKKMNILNFLKDASYQIDLLEDGSYLITMDNHSTHNLQFIYKDNTIIKYELYNELDDSSVILSQENLIELKKWFEKLNLSK